MSDKDGGTAFPVQGYEDGIFGGGNVVKQQGMSLRDYFAAQALPMCIDIATTIRNGGEYELPWTNPAAKAAYEVADAMLAERAK